jgi:hypothetical protein
MDGEFNGNVFHMASDARSMCWRGRRRRWLTTATRTLCVEFATVDTTTLQARAIHVVAPITDFAIVAGVARHLGLFRHKPLKVLVFGFRLLFLGSLLFLLFAPSVEKGLVACHTAEALVNRILANTLEWHNGFTIGTLDFPMVDTGASKEKHLIHVVFLFNQPHRKRPPNPFATRTLEMKSVAVAVRHIHAFAIPVLAVVNHLAVHHRMLFQILQRIPRGC